MGPALSKACANLIRSEEVHRSLVENCPFGIVRTDLITGQIQQANPVISRVLGYTQDELRSITSIQLYADRADRFRLISELKAHGNVDGFETFFRKKDGGLVRCSFCGYIDTDLDTGRQLVQGYLLDITRQRELEEQLRRAHRMDAVGRLAGRVAHDFNNIMQSITLSCELALRNRLAPKLESKLHDIMEQAARAGEITRHLLAFSRKQVLQPSIIDFNHCLRDSLPMISRLVGPDVSIETHFHENLDRVFIDPDQLAIVLMHLASNARAAMPSGGQLRLATSSAPGADAASPARLVTLTVSDTGIGIDQQTLDRIFEPFYSTEETSFTAGLGLSTVHGIISQSHGRIECDSIVGQGTTFRIYLPTAPEPAIAE